MNNKNSKIILKVQNISKNFPGVQALKSVSLDFKSGEIHAVVGENGAGKSTLMKIIAGVYHADNGEIIYQGEKVSWKDPEEAIKAGIITIFQELSVIPNLSVAENIFLGREVLNGPFVSFREMNKKSMELLKIFDLKVDPSVPAGSYSVAIQQMIEITRAISRDAKIIIMDEPTSSLSEAEANKLLQTMKQLSERGVCVIFISHRLEEVLEVADRISVLRDGELIGTLNKNEFDRTKVVEMMVGRRIDQFFAKSKHDHGKEILRVEKLTGNGFRNVSFSLYSGEILGFAGLVGAGRTELMESIFGFRKITSGKIFIEGKEVQINHPLDAIKLGMGFVTEDRKKLGLILIHSIRENIAYANLEMLKSRLGFANKKKEIELSKQLVKEFDIKTPSIEQKVLYLSGGNQQKVVLAKWMPKKPKILILDEPTRGIDVGAKAEIYKLMNELALQGIAVIMVSSELPEILQMSDRIAVMSEGELVDIIPGKDATQEQVMHLATAKRKYEKIS
ncbi:MAG: ribose transport system ATP-binding protein [Thermotogaceae bacterium]|jgi:ribose transport system ATP-binding protein|nr:ribose transport system ATP-binding protein [Thermotogaceae bacterium]MDN5338862.1 ribose transport system ATP-binding protein [Thermotogaceae bacterium]